MCGASAGHTVALRAVTVTLLSIVFLAPLASWAMAQPPQPPAQGPPLLIDGPSSDIVHPSGLGLAVARDGAGGLVYLKNVGGVSHVFVSALLGGIFQPPQQVDAALSGPSSQPVIGASRGGLLLIAFINGGQLYVVDRLSLGAPYSDPMPLAAGARNPSLGVTLFGKAYLAFTVASGGGRDVRTAYYNQGAWVVESPSLNATPGDDAGSGAGAGPRVAAAGDGVAVVVWREAGHIYSRRVWGIAPSIVDEQADAPLVGCSEDAVDDPTVGAGGDSSYADVVFREVLTCSSGQHSRVLMRRLRGSQYEGIGEPDGLSSASPDGADQPQIAMAEYGNGYVTSARDGSNPFDANEVHAALLGSNGSQEGVVRVDSLQSQAPPYAVPATAGLFSNLIAWQQNPGAAGPAEIRARYSPGGAGLGAEMVLSSPGAGGTDAASGFGAAGDAAGDAAIAWVQGNGSGSQIYVAQLYQAPGGLAAVRSFRYARSRRPVLSWSAPRNSWGPMRYRVVVDGRFVGQTTATSLRVPVPLRQGSHNWHVTAVNNGGLQTTDKSARVFVDTFAPAVRASVSGAGTAIHIHVSYSDTRRGLPRSRASGVAKVVVRWGDGRTSRIRRDSSHAYRRPGRYKVTVLVSDRAGNTTRRVLVVRVGGH